jgi:hypothetical protein
MKINRLKKMNLLQVFNLVTTQGTHANGYYEFSGIRASLDIDGYTCWLSYKDLTVTLLFHGMYDFDYQDQDTLDVFFKKVTHILHEHS